MDQNDFRVRTARWSCFHATLLEVMSGVKFYAAYPAMQASDGAAKSAVRACSHTPKPLHLAVSEETSNRSFRTRGGLMFAAS